jgi:hypothetical protein
MSKIFLSLFLLLLFSSPAFAQENSDCMMCHDDKDLKGKRGGRTVSFFFDEKKFANSVHANIDCINCHVDLEDSDFPHEEKLKKADCSMCHSDVQDKYDIGFHGTAAKRGDRLAPLCQTCHGSHDIIPVKNLASKVSPIKIPFLCGSCHSEGTPVQTQRDIPQDSILENYSESIHGEGLLRKGLLVSASCVSCHNSHDILPHTDSRSTIARKNIAETCARCHVAIEEVHRKVIKGELWEKQAHILPACVDCHQPHKVRKVFYEQGVADRDCLSCHEKPDIKSKEGKSLFVNYDEVKFSRHSKISCSQCHTGISPSKIRPCESIIQQVDCASCHSAVGSEYQKSIHGKLFAKEDPNAPTCSECHGEHAVLGKKDPLSPIFPMNIPNLCGSCHKEGEKAAMRYTGTEKEIIENYTESIHGKGLLKSGLTVTATCTDCHTAHRELPHTDPESSVHVSNVAATCGNCHHGIEEKFNKSVHSATFANHTKELPSCNDCHSAHQIIRADSEGFKLMIMNQCGRCHEDVAKTYFDTYHGKVSQLGYTKTAKCYDCHGAHDILPVTNPASHLSRENVVATCQKCHSGATRQFAGYFTHATHHDPDKYPWLFWTFWGMTGLLIGTFFVAGLHTLLWLPRSLQWRRKLKEIHDKEYENNEEEDES